MIPSSAVVERFLSSGRHTGWPQNGTIFVRLIFTKY